VDHVGSGGARKIPGVQFKKSAWSVWAMKRRALAVWTDWSWVRNTIKSDT